MNKITLSLLEVGTNRETGKVVVVGALPEDGFSKAYAYGRAYLEVAAAMIEGARASVHLAYDPGAASTDGYSSRFAVVAGTDQKLSAVLGEAIGRAVGIHDLLVVFGPQDSDVKHSRESLERTVAGDISIFFDVAYPIPCQGPIADLMPMLTQVAARILIPGMPSVTSRVGGTGKKSVVNVIEERIDSAITSSFREKAEKDYGDPLLNGSFGSLHTAHPYLDTLFAVVAEEAGLQLQNASAPMPFELMIMTVHNTIAQSMRNLGMEVSERMPVSKLQPSGAN